jgi:ribosomal protein S18 acetylase RimI-like enzyme
LEHIKERAKAIGMEELLLHTEKDNTIARSFYEKQGFVLSSEAEYWDRKLVRYELALSTT